MEKKEVRAIEVRAENGKFLLVNGVVCAVAIVSEENLDSVTEITEEEAVQYSVPPGSPEDGGLTPGDPNDPSVKLPKDPFPPTKK